MNIKDLVKGKFVKFESFRQENFYYTLRVVHGEIVGDDEEDVYDDYTFPVPLEDIGTATLLAEDKAITYMRWIRKAIADKTLIKS